MKRIFALVLALSALLCGCAKEEVYDHSTFAMDTVMQFKIWGKESEAAALSINGLITELEDTWSATDPGSTLYKVNQGWEKLSDYDQVIVNRATELSHRTEGAFNPRLGKLSQVWGFYGAANQKDDFTVPTAEEISAAIAEAQLDMGAVMKGYAGHAAASILSTFDVDRALLNLGGNVQTFGTKPDGSPWQVGIQNPDGGDYLGIVSVSGTMAVVTSGDYQRYFEKDGVTYHHILDPETGRPANSGLRSVTVICTDGMTADAFSTALFVMGLEKGSEFWRNSNDFEAVFLTEDGKIYATEGAVLSGCAYEVITR